MDHSIVSRVQQAEVDSLDALIGSDCDLERFSDDWHLLAEEIQNAVQSGSLKESTMQTIHAISTHIFIIYQDFLDSRIQADALTSNLMSEIEQLLTNVTLEDSPPNRLHSSPTAAIPDSSPRSAFAPFIEPSYQWLLQNLHNPYPSKNIRESIGCQAGCSVKEIDNWFVEARRRIGWNALRRSRFANKRQSIVEAASRFFGKLNDVPPLNPDLELEFASIQSQAKNLCGQKISERLNLEWGGNVCERRESGRPRKRRCTSSEPDSTTVLSRTCKERRLDYPGCTLHEGKSRVVSDTSSGDAGSRASSIAPSQSSCSSPASSTSCLTPVSTPTPISLETFNHTSATAPLKRKRRLSFSNGAESPKRPRIACSGPRSHAVSDPIPRASISISSPFENSSYGMDPSNLLEIELFDPSVLFSSPEGSCEGAANEAAYAPATDVLHGQAQTKTLVASDPLHNHVHPDNSSFEVQPSSTNDLPYLNIALDGLTDQTFGSGFDWLTSFLSDSTCLEPSSLFQMDLPPINDVFSLDYVVPSAVY